MEITWVFIFAVLLGISVEGRKGFGPGEQEFGYVDVRPGAHMFYWLYYTTADGGYINRPLVMWLQGGPGGSSTSFGNFEEIGPLTTDLKTRNSTWVNHVNLLFVDNPVGTGFSYVDKKPLLATTNQQIGKDLVELMRGFLQKHSSFEDVPFYIFCESYGGKMTAEFALQLEKERLANKIKVNFKGVGLGDSWISPVDSVLTWGPYLYHTGLVDQEGFEEVNKYAKRTAEAVKTGNYFQATDLWSKTEQIIWKEAGNVDFYNILTPIQAGRSSIKSQGMIDEAGLKTITKTANKAKEAIDDGEFNQATILFREAQQDVMEAANGAVDFYNILVKKGGYYRKSDYSYDPLNDGVLAGTGTARADDATLQKLMNGAVRLALGDTIPKEVLHGSQSGYVFSYLYQDFMKPVTDVVEELLNTTRLDVVVYTGQLDLIVDTPGTVQWVDRLKWPEGDNWQRATRRSFVVDGVVEGFVKNRKNLSLYWINRAGHMVPADNPATMLELLRIVTKFDKNNHL